jgi:hypothetical protein
MKKLFILLLWFAVASHSYAQDAVNQPLLDYFQNMDMNQVNTGTPVAHSSEPNTPLSKNLKNPPFKVSIYISNHLFLNF